MSKSPCQVAPVSYLTTKFSKMFTAVARPLYGLISYPCSSEYMCIYFRYISKSENCSEINNT